MEGATITVHFDGDEQALNELLDTIDEDDAATVKEVREFP